MRRLRAILLLLAIAAVALAALAPASMSARLPTRDAKTSAVPFGFVGMNLDGPILSDPLNMRQQFNEMVGSGVQSIRIRFTWAGTQSKANGPIDFTQDDEFVGLAAEHGLTVLPIVEYAPAWDAAPHAAGTFATPARDAPFASYVRALVMRYGPRGSYWAQNPTVPRRPIRMWQIWNEPNFVFYWSIQPFAPTYVRLLKAAHTAIKQADPGAKVVLAGTPNYAWTYLAQIYAVKGARNDFDVAAVHPYTMEPKNVIEFMQLVRNVMDRNGDARKPLLATETAWSSSLGEADDDYCCQTTRSGQAKDIAALLPLLGAHRRELNLLGFYYYTWLDQEQKGDPSFSFAGLSNYTGSQILAKPALGAFTRGALALENCRRKGSTATRCLKTG